MSFVATTTKRARLGAHILKSSVSSPRRHNSSSVIDSDVVIVGGGPAGLALASALGSSSSIRQNVSITLVEGGDLDKVKSWHPAPGTFSNRVVSLTNTSRVFLEDIGAWKYVEEGRTCAVEQMQVWDGISDARIEFSAEDLPSEASGSGMARLTENFNLQRGLLRHLDQIPEIKLLQKKKVTSISPDLENGGWPIVQLDDQQAIRARLLIGADGFNSPVKTFANIPSFGWPYNRQAIVATMIHPPRGAFEAPNTTCYQRFLPTGPIAFLPLSPTVSSLVWSTKPELATALLSADANVLASMINAAFRLPELSLRYLHHLILDAHTSGKPITPQAIQEEIRWRESSHAIDQNSAFSSSFASPTQGIPPADSEAVPPLVGAIQPGSAASFPLRYSHAEAYLGEGAGSRTVLVGDAAHTVHPLAGQGLNLGLADAECLARTIEHALETGGDIGSYTALLPYAQERYLANHTLMSTMDKLHKIYSTDNETVVWARSVGVEVLNELDTLKSAMMITAGAAPSKRSTASAGWTFAGNAVETLAAGAKTAGVVKDVLIGALGSAVNSFANNSRR